MITNQCSCSVLNVEKLLSIQNCGKNRERLFLYRRKCSCSHIAKIACNLIGIHCIFIGHSICYDFHKIFLLISIVYLHYVFGSKKINREKRGLLVFIKT